jgi:hypothetical protein
MAAESQHWSMENKDKSSEPTNLEGHQLGVTKAAQGESPHTTQEPGEEAGQPQPHEESCEAPGELMPQGGEHTGSPGVGGGDCSGTQHQVDSATKSLTNTVECRLVPMYQVIGLSVAVALLMLLLMSILRMVLDIMIRAITMARVRSWGWWLMGAFWGVLLQVAAVPVQWAMAKRHVVGKAATCPRSAGAVRLQVKGAEAQRMSPEDAGESLAPGTGLNNMDRLMSWPDEFFGRGITDQVYLVSTIEGEQAAMGVTAADRDAENENSRMGSIPTDLWLLTRSSPDRDPIFY